MFCSPKVFVKNCSNVTRQRLVVKSEPPIKPELLTDSYKMSHMDQYQKSLNKTAYGSFRAPFPGANDNRFIFIGMRPIIEKYIAKPWTIDNIIETEAFFNTFGPGGTSHPFPRKIFEKFVMENDGFIPVKIEAVPEGTVAYVGTPVYQISAEGEYSCLVTFLETLLTMVWYPSTVATLSRLCKEIIRVYFDKTVDEDAYWKIDHKMHDFGFRGCTCVEQAIIGGSAHLVNFTGSDTSIACWNVQQNLNNGKPRGSSIPASEHSVMTSWSDEKLAFDHLTQLYKKEVFATVMDSYDYENALNNIVPMFIERVVDANGLWVLRPDSGDPVETVLQALHAAEKALLSLNREGLVVVNKKGYKVLKNINVIQGDGITMDTIEKILEATTSAGFSAENITFGMGGGLLQKVNRDTMSFATKLSEITDIDGNKIPIMKAPKTDGLKVSLPGEMKVCMNADGYLEARTPEEDGDNLLEVVYDGGYETGHIWPLFDDIVENVEKGYKNLKKKISGPPYSESLKIKQSELLMKIRENK